MNRLALLGKSVHGQAIVEFAVVLVLLLMLVIGVFEFGRAWNIYQVITDAARGGARMAVVADPGVVAWQVPQASRCRPAPRSASTVGKTITRSGRSP